MSLFNQKAGIYLISGVEKASDMVHQANVIVYHVWLKTIFLTWEWWILLAVGIIPWITWTAWRPKERTNHLLFAGIFVMVSCYSMDDIGLGLGLWSYPIKEIPLIPSYIIWDLCVMPVCAMFTIQFKPNMNQLIKAIGLATAGAFVIQPIAVLTGYYHMKHWSHFYSFLLVIIIYLFAYFFYNGRSWKKPSAK